MFKRTRIKDGWEMFISIFALLASIVILLFAYRAQEQTLQIREENEVLKYWIVQLCNYINTLPRHRAVFEACLENFERR